MLYILTIVFTILYGLTFQGFTKAQMFPCKFEMWPCSRPSIFKRGTRIKGVACSPDILSKLRVNVTGLTCLFYDTFRDATSFCAWRYVFFSRLTQRLLLFPAADSGTHILIPFVFQLHRSSFIGIQSFSSAEFDKTFSASKTFVELEPRTPSVEDFISISHSTYSNRGSCSLATRGHLIWVFP